MKYVRGVILVAAILLLWAVGSMFFPPLFLPSPQAVGSTFIDLIKNGVLIKGLGMSFFRITVATLLSAAVSVPMGLLVANYRIMDNIVSPVIGFMRYMPVTAFYPLLIMWAGIGEGMKIAFLFFATVFYFLPSVVLAVKEVNPDLVDTARTMGMSNWQVMTQVLLPASAPSICHSFLMMYGIGWTYVIIAEVVNAVNGLGHLMNVASARGRTDMVFSALAVVMAFSFAFDTIGNRIIKRVFRWKYIRQSQSIFE